MYKKAQQRFLYRGHAVGVAASFSKPLNEHVDSQASCALGVHGGTAKARVDGFAHRDILSFSSAYTSVIGIPSADEKSHGTVTTATVEGLNVLNMVTADRVVVRLAARHHMDGVTEHSLLGTGSHIDNLKVAGHPVTVTYDADFLANWDTWSKALDGAKKRASGVAIGPDFVYTTVVAKIGDAPGLAIQGNRIDIPEFGSIYIGEVLIKPARRKLTMMRIALGCATHGDVTICDTDNNGTPVPPTLEF